MKIIRNLVIGGKEPTDVNVGWLKPTEDNSFRLLVFNGDGWYPVAIDVTIESVGELMFQYIEDIPDIVIEKEQR